MFSLTIGIDIKSDYEIYVYALAFHIEVEGNYFFWYSCQKQQADNTGVGSGPGRVSLKRVGLGWVGSVYNIC